MFLFLFCFTCFSPNVKGSRVTSEPRRSGVTRAECLQEAVKIFGDVHTEQQRLKGARRELESKHKELEQQLKKKTGLVVIYHHGERAYIYVNAVDKAIYTYVWVDLRCVWP